MTTSNGWPVWYELMTPDPAAIAPFYKAVLGWDIPDTGTTMPNGADYRWITRAEGGHEGGVFRFDQQMIDAGAKGAWMPYFYAADVDAAVEKASQTGATVHMPPMTMEPAGRMAMLADPQGAMFYVITPTPPADQPDAQSDAFSADTPGRCAWNELNTPDAAAQLDFYAGVFGWNYGFEMPMPGDHIYKFINLDGTDIGAIGSMMPPGFPTAWLAYFRVDDIEVARQAVTSQGGSVLMGPHEVPGDDMILVVSDPAGAVLGLAARKAA